MWTCYGKLISNMETCPDRSRNKGKKGGKEGKEKEEKRRKSQRKILEKTAYSIRCFLLKMSRYIKPDVPRCVSIVLSSSLVTFQAFISLLFLSLLAYPSPLLSHLPSAWPLIIDFVIRVLHPWNSVAAKWNYSSSPKISSNAKLTGVSTTWGFLIRVIEAKDRKWMTKREWGGERDREREGKREKEIEEDWLRLSSFWTLAS